MTERDQKNDPYTGIPWVYVTAEEVRGHPKGQLSAALYAIAAYLIFAGLLKMGINTSAGVPLGWAILVGSFPLLSGLGLLIRAPWAIVLATLSAGATVFQLVMGFSGGLGSAVAPGFGTLEAWTLFHLLASVGIVFHLMDGDRPNFIYRHRYRKYSVLKEGGDD